MGLCRSRIGKTGAEEFLRSLDDLNVYRTDPVSYDDVFKLAERSGLTVYDGAYLMRALATIANPADVESHRTRRLHHGGVSAGKPTGPRIGSALSAFPQSAGTG